MIKWTSLDMCERGHEMGIRRRIDHEEVIRMHLDGIPGNEIAEELGCCKATVCKILNDAGYSMKSGLDKGKIMALHRAGWRIKDIAWDMSIKEETVREVLEENKEDLEK